MGAAVDVRRGQRAILNSGQNGVQDWVEPDLRLQDKNVSGEPEAAPQRLRDLLRTGERLRLYAVQA